MISRKWTTVAKGLWRVYASKRLKPRFVLLPRYAQDKDFEARVQIRRRRN